LIFVITQFVCLPFLVSKKTNPKNRKKQQKSKKNIFDVFALVLAFSASFQKNNKFKNLLLTHLVLNALILKSLINFIESKLTLFFFLNIKIQKNMKNKKIFG
jgi:hypothetical protein